MDTLPMSYPFLPVIPCVENMTNTMLTSIRYPTEEDCRLRSLVGIKVEASGPMTMKVMQGEGG
jgi:hypothetical protein